MYEQFYGLSARPFRMTPDLKYFCLTQAHKRALAHLRYGLQQAEGFIVFTGAPGTGKTLLSQILLKELDDKSVHVANISNALMEDEEILSSLLIAFGRSLDHQQQPRALLSQCEAFLLSRAQRGARCVALIDQAQHLSQKSLERLRLLSNMQFQHNPILQIILVGDITLDDHIFIQENHLLRQRVILSYQLNAFSFRDTAYYIKHRLKVAGAENEPNFTNDVVEIIQSLAQGVPGEINRLCDRLLMQGMLRSKYAITKEDVSQLLIDDSQFKRVEAITFVSPKIIEKPIIDTVFDTMAEFAVDADVETILEANTEVSNREVSSRETNNRETKADINAEAKREAVSVETLQKQALNLASESPMFESTEPDLSIRDTLNSKKTPIEESSFGEEFMGELEKEFEKELSSNSESTSSSFQTSKAKKNTGVLSMLALTYAISLGLAILLFYSDGLNPIADAVAGLVENFQVQSTDHADRQPVSKGESSLAINH